MTQIVPKKGRQMTRRAWPYWPSLEDFTGFDNFFENWADKMPAEAGKLGKLAFAPACDVKENGQEISFNFDLPGLKKDEIKIEVEGDRLTVSGERKEEKTEEGEKRYFSETYYGSFMRSFTLPTAVDAERVTAEYDNGVLKVKVPKEGGSKTREVKVR